MAIGKDEIGMALAALAETHNREVTETTVEAYHLALGDSFDPESWTAAVVHVMRTCRFWPTPADFLDALNPEADTEAIVGAVIVAVTDGRYREYDPNGSRWNTRRMRDELGEAAVEAWLEAGGAAAFDTIESSKFGACAFGKIYRRRLTAEAKAGRLDPGLLLRVGSEPCQLPARKPRPAIAERALSAEDAQRALEDLEVAAGVRWIARPEKPELTTDQRAERLEELERQRAELLS